MVCAYELRSHNIRLALSLAINAGVRDAERSKCSNEAIFLKCLLLSRLPISPTDLWIATGYMLL